MNEKRLLITGGAGFIGSALVRFLIKNTRVKVCNLDKLTYAGNPASLSEVADSGRYEFVQADIADAVAVKAVFDRFQPDAVMHLAAESHVDRSIDNPLEFVQTNVMGTANLLNIATEYWKKSGRDFRFQHISTDEVYGSLGRDGLFTESTPYAPKSPYSASKAAADHLVRAWGHTFKLPILISNCSNNYGPYHFPEKLIPLVILNALDGKSLPIYGNGAQIRDWLYVDDHVKALWLINQHGIPGETYNIGGHNERTNLAVVQTICRLLDELKPKENGRYADQITFVNDRPGHDLRYAIDAGKLQRELGWQPEETFETGLRKTVEWYLNNAWWWQPIRSGNYAGERLGEGL